MINYNRNNIPPIAPHGNVWFTADTHFNHANIIKYCKRPFSSSQEMDEALIANWNSRVQKNDTVYFLGDFCFAKGSQADKMNIVKRYLNRLNGKLHIIVGNHDKPISLLSGFFSSYQDVKLINVNAQSIYLSHFAHRVWPGSHHSSWSLYGHSHGTLQDDTNSLSFDVGVDCHEYFPISFERVKEIISKKNRWKINH